MTALLIRLAELVIILNNFSLDGEHHRQECGVAMGRKRILLVLWEKICKHYTDPLRDFFGR